MSVIIIIIMMVKSRSNCEGDSKTNGEGGQTENSRVSGSETSKGPSESESFSSFSGVLGPTYNHYPSKT